MIGRLLFALLLALQGTNVISQRQEVKTLLQNYDPQQRPKENNGSPVNVMTNLYLRSLEQLDDDLNNVEMQLTFRMEWNDTRLAHSPTVHSNPFTRYFNFADPKVIWTPDIFFSNSKSGFRNGILSPNVLLRVYPDGRILLSNRITLQLKCNSEPEMFPLDKVTCPIIFASYGLTTQDEYLQWKSENPVQITKNLHLKSFLLKRVETKMCNARTITGEYPCLKAELFLERTPLRTYFFYLYLPSLGLVVLSWLTFFIKRKASEIIRLTLTLTFTLLMVLTCTSLWHIRPHYSYITPADIWVFVSAIFVFYAMLHYIGSRFVPCLSCQSGSVDKETTEKSNEVSKPFLKAEEKESKLKIHSKRLQRSFQSNKADVAARFLYPFVYIVFVIVYSITYMPSSSTAPEIYKN